VLFVLRKPPLTCHDGCDITPTEFIGNHGQQNLRNGQRVLPGHLPLGMCHEVA
jgi:hypothetical protein